MEKRAGLGVGNLCLVKSSKTYYSNLLEGVGVTLKNTSHVCQLNGLSLKPVKSLGTDCGKQE